MLSQRTFALVACSDNWPADTLTQAMAALPLDALRTLKPGDPPVTVGTLPGEAAAQSVTGHLTDEHALLEFEDAPPDTIGEAPIYSLTRQFLPKLQQASRLETLTDLVAAEMKRLTGFGRCLVYRFDDAGHGEVLSERLDPGYDSYAGHHFPATDIPKQARELYVLNQFRLIADATYTPVPLRMKDAAATPTTVDLSRAQLRSVSPVHLEYMRNMGTLASMSASIVVDGRLWGLISCHDHAPRHLSAPTRLACEHLGQLLALQVQAQESNRVVAERLELRKITLGIVSHLADSDATLRTLVAQPWLTLQVAKATGAAVVLDDEVWTVGDVPATPQLLQLSQWIAGLGQDVYESHALARHYVPGAEFQHVAAGVLAISISQVHRHLVIWFRPEIVQTITWAGNPQKAQIEADGRIHPRRSFESWAEDIRGQSAAWTESQVSAVRELRQALIGIVLRRAEELAAVASELGRVNKELEAFSYTVSHDLRAPMRHIAGYVDLVVETERKQLGERSLRYLGHVKEAAAFAGQLVDALLDFSRMGRAALKSRAVDTDALVDGLVRELTRTAPDRRIEWSIDPALPSLHADPLLLQVAVRNLLSNAVKYSRASEVARITVRGIRRPDGDGLEVEDNGVGFQMKYVDKLFGVFQRLHQAEEFEGTGIGLANVKRIVERHGGTVWARGDIGKGASFGFSLPRLVAQAPTLPNSGDFDA